MKVSELLAAQRERLMGDKFTWGKRWPRQPNTACMLAYCEEKENGEYIWGKWEGPTADRNEREDTVTFLVRQAIDALYPDNKINCPTTWNDEDAELGGAQSLDQVISVLEYAEKLAKIEEENDAHSRPVEMG